MVPGIIIDGDSLGEFTASTSEVEVKSSGPEVLLSGPSFRARMTDKAPFMDEVGFDFLSIACRRSCRKSNNFTDSSNPATIVMLCTV